MITATCASGIVLCAKVTNNDDFVIRVENATQFSSADATMGRPVNTCNSDLLGIWKIGGYCSIFKSSCGNGSGMVINIVSDENGSTTTSMGESVSSVGGVIWYF
ncbi:hypothetical protein AVEN_47958-1 [Araneus ventricosus]|uniref:Uncharacterized protein n=1 Tax=Araneus ventricosus TaxID=182803 RepID=A0A4Y2DS72_ARAVE|nr:hypothetical protein AVEN_47958-1 [Araneus ventricosus]